jgi:hypothetical protein
MTNLREFLESVSDLDSGRGADVVLQHARESMNDRPGFTDRGRYMQPIALVLASVLVFSLIVGGVLIAARVNRHSESTVSIQAGSRSGSSSAESCSSAPAAAALPSGVTLRLRLGHKTLDTARAVSGAVNAALIIRNDGTQDFAIETGRPIVATLVDERTHEAIGHYGGPVRGIAFSPRIVPGTSLTIPVIVGTNRCGSRHAELVPPGAYGATASVTSADGAIYFAPLQRLHITG